MSLFFGLFFYWYVIFLGLSYSMVCCIPLPKIWIPEKMKYGPLIWFLDLQYDSSFLQERTSGSSSRPSAVSQKRDSPTWRLSSSSLARSLPSSTDQGVVVMLRWDYHNARNEMLWNSFWVSTVHHCTITCLSYLQVPLSLFLSLIHIWRCRRIERCRSRWSPYH